MENEYRVKVSVRNNLILSAIESLGFRSAAAFCRHYGLCNTSVSSLATFRKPPITNDGEFCKEAKDLMEALGAAPSDLWTDAQLTMKMEKNSRESLFNEKTMRYLIEQHNECMTLPDPADIVDEAMTAAMVGDLLSTVTKKEEKVLRLRFGVGINAGEKTLEEVADVLSVSRERIRQIEGKAVRKLRYPTRLAIVEGKINSKQWREKFSK